jgi:diguanylate cyclase (GGDEF)-like protein
MTGGARPEENGVAYLAEEARRDVHPLQAALYDPVTGLPERALLLDRMELALARARRGDNDVAMLLLTIDDLDGLRERLGTTQGDRILREFGERVAGAVRDTDTVARFGPAEFAVLCEGVTDRDTLMLVAGRVASGLADPFPVRFGTIRLDIGMEVLLVGGETPPLALLDMAEQALRETHERRGDA